MGEQKYVVMQERSWSGEPAGQVGLHRLIKEGPKTLQVGGRFSQPRRSKARFFYRIFDSEAEALQFLETTPGKAEMDDMREQLQVARDVYHDATKALRAAHAAYGKNLWKENNDVE